MTDTLLEIAKTFGTPCYVYYMDRVRERVDLVRTAFGNRFRIGYAVKCNPNPGVLRRMKRIVDQLDVSSSGEILAALDAGWSPSTLGFTGPGKTRDELQLALGKGVGEVILESVAEAELLNELAEEAHKTQPVLVRIAPSTVPRGFGLNLSGKPTQFGVDENEIDSTLKTIMGLRGLDLHGFHILLWHTVSSGRRYRGELQGIHRDLPADMSHPRPFATEAHLRLRHRNTILRQRRCRGSARCRRDDQPGPGHIEE